MTQRKTMIGDYGPWAAGLVGAGADRPGQLSFRNDCFTSLPAWRKKAMAKTLELLAQPAKPAGRLAVRVERKVCHDGLAFEELSWQLPYGRRTRAVFIKPADASGSRPARLPGVLALHDHGGNKFWGVDKIARLPGQGRQHPMMRYHQSQYYGGGAWANELARRGYGVLVHDAFAFASRRVRCGDVTDAVAGGCIDPDPASSRQIVAYNQWAGGHENLLAKSLFAAGTTWPGVFLYEDQRALDYLAGRPDIDSRRLGCGGLSGGGLRTCLLAGLDHRIKAAVDVGFMTTWRDQVLDKCHTHTWMAFVPLLPNYLDWPEVLGLRVPLATLVLNDRADELYTLAEMKRADRILATVYAKARAADRYRCSFYPGPHKFDRAMQAEAFAWFDRWLG